VDRRANFVDAPTWSMRQRGRCGNVVDAIDTALCSTRGQLLRVLVGGMAAAR